MPTPKNGFQILNLHPKKMYLKKIHTLFLMYFCLSFTINWMKMRFSKNEYSEGVKIHGLAKIFWENFIFWSKALEIGRFIEENLFFHMVPLKFI